MSGSARNAIQPEACPTCDAACSLFMTACDATGATLIYSKWPHRRTV